MGAISMKITGQNVPPEMAAAYAAVITTVPTATVGLKITKQAKAVTLLKRRAKVNKMLESCKRAVKLLVKYKESQGGWTKPTNFEATQAQAIYSGVFDPEYWIECSQQSVATLENVPTFTAYTGPRPYSYPDPNNQPTKAIYGNGTNSTGNPYHTGQTIGNTYRDTLLKWKRFVFDLQNSDFKGGDEPLFLSLKTTITANASNRGSRAMLSLILQWWLVEQGSYKETTTEPPTEKPVSELWRYLQPITDPPYFAELINRRFLKDMRMKSREMGANALTRAVVIVSPMPMMGKRFNNNTSVQTEVSITEIKLFQIKKAMPYLMKNANWADFGFGLPPFVYLNSVDEAIAWMDAAFPTKAPYYAIEDPIDCSYDQPYNSMKWLITSDEAAGDPQRQGQVNWKNQVCEY